MSGLVLTARQAPPRGIDLSALVPDRLAGLSPAEAARVALPLPGGDAVAAGDLFAVTGEPGDALRLVGGLGQARGIGRGMRGGTLVVEGDAGDDTGLEMAGGTLLVRGSAGRRTGGAAPGAKRGMTGGQIVVLGDAGELTGACLRRGVIAVAGGTGPGTAEAAIAGTVVVGGATGPHPGRWSKRGSIVALGAVEPPATYAYACTYRPPAVAVLLRWLAAAHRFPVSPAQVAGRYRRFAGDLAETGKGEILHWTGE